MIKIGLLKNDRLTVGNPKQVAEILDKNPETIRRWAKAGKKVFCAGYEVITNIELFKSK